MEEWQCATHANQTHKLFTFLRQVNKIDTVKGRQQEIYCYRKFCRVRNKNCGWKEDFNKINSLVGCLITFLMLYYMCYFIEVNSNSEVSKHFVVVYVTCYCQLDKDLGIYGRARKILLAVVRKQTDVVW